MRCLIIGGGAAGFFGAIACATTYPQTEVIILEAGSQALSKVRISGGGRCNVTHHCFEAGQLIQYYPRGGKALRGAFTRFQPQDTVNWFESQGVKLKTEADGRIFPCSDNSETIVNCLLNTAKKLGIKLKLKAAVRDIEKKNIGFTVELKNGELRECDRLLIATGSNRLGYKWAEKLGHKIINPVPSLFTFNISDARLKGLAGISIENVDLRLLNTGKTKLQQRGPLLITHWGISGPAVLKLSAWGARILQENNYCLSLQINWLPEYNLDTLLKYLLTLKSDYSQRKIFNYSGLNLPKRLWQKLITFVEINEQISWAEISKKQLNKLAQELTQGRYQITGKGIFKEEFVTCGGVSLKEINFQTMESKLCPGLYLAGEILDIDGVTGGFNFQSAWTTGWLAGKAMGELFK